MKNLVPLTISIPIGDHRMKYIGTMISEDNQVYCLYYLEPK